MADTRTVHTMPIKDCCGVLLGDVCDCAAFHAEAMALFEQVPPLILRTGPGTAPAAPSTSFPTSISLVNVGGLLRRVDSPAFAEEQK